MLLVLLAILFATSVSAKNDTAYTIVHTQDEDMYHGPEDEPLKYETLVADADGVFRPKAHQFKKRLSNNPSHSDSFENAVSHYLKTGSKRRFLQTYGCSYSLIATACCENSGDGPNCAACPG